MQLNKCSRLFLLLPIFFISCQSNEENTKERQDLLFKEHNSEILSDISKMLVADQRLRTYYSYGATDPNAIDSIRHALAEKGINADSIAAVGSLLPPPVLDSVSLLLRTQDTRHTKKAIEIIKKYGFPTSERIGDSSSNIDPTLLFQHADTSYKKEILALLYREIRFGRIDTNCLEGIKWHLNGRVGIPDLKGVTIVHVDIKTGKADTIRN
jgi:hypothetical protein